MEKIKLLCIKDSIPQCVESFKKCGKNVASQAIVPNYR